MGMPRFNNQAEFPVAFSSKGALTKIKKGPLGLSRDEKGPASVPKVLALKRRKSLGRVEVLLSHIFRSAKPWSAPNRCAWPRVGAQSTSFHGGVRKSRFALAEGDVVVTFPENLSANSVEDLDGFWQVFIKKARRQAGTKK
jgi:hypothetical protein